MKTINHECYVDLEVAKLLKEAGFDWEIRSLYDEQNNFVCSLYRDWNNVTICKSAPTLEVAQRWLREVKGIEVNVLCVYINHDKKYSYAVFEGKYNNESIDDGFDTYEEAQDAGIKKAFELILEKGE